MMGGLQMTTLGETLAYTVEKGDFIQIINDKRNHWITVSNIGCKPNHFNVYDSIPSGNVSPRAIQQISAIALSNAKEITLNFPTVQSQKGGSDCGLFSIAFATTFCVQDLIQQTCSTISIIFEDTFLIASTRDALVRSHVKC